MLKSKAKYKVKNKEIIEKKKRKEKESGFVRANTGKGERKYGILCIRCLLFRHLGDIKGRRTFVVQARRSARGGLKLKGFLETKSVVSVLWVLTLRKGRGTHEPGENKFCAEKERVAGRGFDT